MRILVTGGSGFIGSNLLPALAAMAEVVNLDTAPPRNPAARMYWRPCSILDARALMANIREFAPTHVVHLAARTDLGGSTVAEYAANSQGVLNVIRAVGATDSVKHTFYASSRLVFAIEHKPTHTYDYNPSTAYGQSKVEGEMLVRKHAAGSSSWTILRPTSIWGPWFETPYRDFFDMVAKGRYVKFRGRDPLKSFGYVGNVVHQVVQFLDADPGAINERAFWLSDYEPLRLSAWADAVASALGKPAPRFAPWPLARFAAKLGDFASQMGVKPVPLTTFRLNNLVTDMTYDTLDTQRVVGPLPYSMADGVRITADWYRESRDKD